MCPNMRVRQYSAVQDSAGKWSRVKYFSEYNIQWPITLRHKELILTQWGGKGRGGRGGREGVGRVKWRGRRREGQWIKKHPWWKNGSIKCATALQGCNVLYSSAFQIAVQLPSFQYYRVL